MPFKELRIKESLEKVENNTCGLGLSYSQQIAHQLDGKIRVKLNRKNLTVIQLFLPIKVQDFCRLDPNTCFDTLKQAENNLRFLKPRKPQNLQSIADSKLKKYLLRLKDSSLLPLDFENGNSLTLRNRRVREENEQ